MEICNVDSFANNQLKLLELEREAEIEENRYLQENISTKRLQEKGVCIPRLKVLHRTTGLFGRIILKFVPLYAKSISANTISSGDIVGIGNVNSDGKIEVLVSGVVSFIHDSHLTVALEKDDSAANFEGDGVYSLIKLANDVTYRRLKRLIKTLQAEADKIHLVDFLFGSKSLSVLESNSISGLVFYNSTLNETQRESVQFALSMKEVAILHGPPGTGKTTTVVECILQCVSQKLKVIACAPSNIAVDNLVEKLAAHKVKIVRLGHPARVLSEIQKYSLDAIVSQYDGCDVIEEMQSEMAKLKVKIESTRGPKKHLWNENKSLLKEIKTRQTELVKQILTNADVVLATLTSASEDGPIKQLGRDHFDICFIDECSQALEIACWIPLTLAKRCVLAGDHNQLPPTIISEKASKQGLSITLMDRLLKLHGDPVKKMLTIQYRMNETIMQWPSNQLYGGKLIAHDSVKSHLLCDLPDVENDENTAIPLLLIDTAGCDLYELQAEDEESKGNEGEADLVSVHVENLVKSGVRPSAIAVITPYNLQVDLIKARCSGKYPKLEIKSVDGFQGREKEAVVLSLVRSNDSGEVGFLSEDRRTNVAITRAKRHLAVICNTVTVSHSPFLKSFVSYCEERAEVRSAQQYESQIGQYMVPVKRASNKTKQTSSKCAKKDIDKTNFNSESSEVLKSQHRKEMDEAKRLATDLKYREVIQSFVGGPGESYSFSPDLSPFERRVVHEIAEELGLVHSSQGEGSERFIIISKVVPSTSHSNCTVIENSEERILDSPDKCEVELKPEQPELKYESKSPCVQNPKVMPKKKKPQPSSSKPKNKTLSFSENPDEDFDELIAQAVKADRTCSFQKCKKSVAVMSQDCQFCKGRFCFSHFIPEAHGCGDLAKSYARGQIRKQGVVYPGSGKPVKKVDPIKQNYLKKKLNEKINGMTIERKSKPNS